MEELKLTPSQVLFEAQEPIQHVYFPHSGVVSLLVVMGDGSAIEAGSIGNEGVVGLGGMLAGDVSFSRQVVQLAGRATRIARAPFLAAADESRTLRGRLAKHADTFVAQCLQTAACNATHSLRQRLARWLLTMADRSGQEILPLTQGSLGEILAVRRSSVTLVARVMQGAGLIDYQRGVITIRSRAGLRLMACECYEIIRQTYDEAFAADIERD